MITFLTVSISTRGTWRIFAPRPILVRLPSASQDFEAYCRRDASQRLNFPSSGSVEQQCSMWWLHLTSTRLGIHAGSECLHTHLVAHGSLSCRSHGSLAVNFGGTPRHMPAHSCGIHFDFLSRSCNEPQFLALENRSIQLSITCHTAMGLGTTGIFREFPRTTENSVA
jgi:hypothetical protein